MSIPISRPIIGLEEEEAVLNVLRSGMIAGGAKVVEFEEAFADSEAAAEETTYKQPFLMLLIHLQTRLVD